MLPFSRTVSHEGKNVRRTGRVKWFHENGGYGMIRPAAGGRDVQVHYTDIEGKGFRTLCEGEWVEYELAEGPRGSRAIRIKSMPESRSR